MRKAGNWFSGTRQIKFLWIDIFGVKEETGHKNIYDVIKIQRKMKSGRFQIAINYINKSQQFAGKP